MPADIAKFTLAKMPLELSWAKTHSHAHSKSSYFAVKAVRGLAVQVLLLDGYTSLCECQ